MVFARNLAYRLTASLNKAAPATEGYIAIRAHRGAFGILSARALSDGQYLFPLEDDRERLYSCGVILGRVSFPRQCCRSCHWWSVRHHWQRRDHHCWFVSDDTRIRIGRYEHPYRTARASVSADTRRQQSSPRC